MLPELAIVCLYGDLEGQVTIVKPCDSALVPVPSAAPRRGVRGTTYGTSRPPVRKESTGEHDGVGVGIGAELAKVTRARSDPHPVAESPRPSCSTGRFQRAKVGKTVHAPPACQHGRSLGSMLEGLATACGYGDPERHLTIVKRCKLTWSLMPCS